MSILEVITGSLAGILERAAYEVERRTQPRTVEDLRLLSDDVTRAELRHALRRTLDQRDEIARNAEESRRYERERYQAAQTRSDELSATLDRLTAGQKDPLLVELTSELSKRKGENDAWDDGPVETLRRIIGERDDLKQQVSKAGIQLREALDEELQQIDDAMAEAGGERDGDAAAFIAELASELDAIQSVLEANDWLNDGETVVDSVRSLDAARAQLAKLRDEALDKVADIETVNRTLSDASIEMAERIARLEANAGKGGTVLSCVCNHLTRNHVDGTGACETPDCECIEFEPGVRISDGEGGQSAPSVQHEQAYNSQYPVSVTFRCDACKNSSTQTVTVAAVEALQRQLAQYAEHHCSCRVAPRPEPADDGIIRAAEGVVLEPGEYDSIDPTGSSRFRIGAPKWPSSEVGGIWYWRVSTFLPSVTAVRRVEAQPGHVTDDDVARAQHYAHLLRTDSASENPHWDGGHPPPASDIEQACGCDESKRLRERVERTDAKLADLGKERDKQIEKLYEWLNAWQDWAKGVVPQPEMGWHGDHKNRELIEAAFKERDAINLALLGTEFQTGGVPLSAVVRKLMSKSRELKSGNAMLAEQKKQVETLAIKRGEAIEKLTNQLLALAQIRRGQLMPSMAEVWAELGKQCSGPHPDDDESTGHTCRRCQGTYHLTDGSEPTGLCNNCAQDICLEIVPMLLGRIADVGKLIGNEGCSCVEEETGEGANHEGDLYSCERDGHEPCFAHLVERALFGDKGLESKPMRLFQNSEVIYAAESLEQCWKLFQADMGYDDKELTVERGCDPFEELPQGDVLEQVFEDKPDEPTAKEAQFKPDGPLYWTVSKTVAEWCAGARAGHFSGGEY